MAIIRTAPVLLSAFQLRLAVKLLSGRGSITPEELAAGRRLGAHLQGILERMESNSTGAT